MILRDVEVEGRRVDVAMAGGRITAIGPDLADDGDGDGDEVVDGDGGALFPGLHDHHIHVLSLAARDRSIALGPPAVTSRDAFDEALAAAARRVPPGSWLRGVGYDDHTVGPIDRRDLDRVVPGHPVRVQHRSGAAWVLNSKALAASGLPGDGAVHGSDHELRAAWGTDVPDLPAVGRRLAGYGVTGVTDATVSNGPEEAALLTAALPQRVAVMGGPDLPAGHRKLVVAEYQDPDPDGLAASIAAAHADNRAVAIHAASRASLVLALAALDEIGTWPGDRIEHASVAPPELVAWMAGLGVTVVTQPNFVAEHGDRYLVEVEPADQPWLYRGRGFVDGGVGLAAGTDAPFGDPDPWVAIRAAVDRRTAGGATLGSDEGLRPEEALGLFLGAADDPAGPPRTVALGADADLCLLAAPWADARDVLTSDLVALTVVDGEVVHAGRGR